MKKREPLPGVTDTPNNCSDVSDRRARADQSAHLAVVKLSAFFGSRVRGNPWLILTVTLKTCFTSTSAKQLVRAAGLPAYCHFEAIRRVTYSNSKTRGSTHKVLLGFEMNKKRPRLRINDPNLQQTTKKSLKSCYTQIVYPYQVNTLCKQTPRPQVLKESRCFDKKMII
ncbi:unnamed protein product [Leptidea sinapis]|uniref:Uncharacterized protein n=1 Tax=Leptidea sinapis TaxID=189913 RepID=A0A5E4QHL4_9NEOP|nr:unnamed protein product [Leptidea sinapis]